MEVREGTIPLAALAILFIGLQVWWIGITVKNGRRSTEAIINRKDKKRLQKDILKVQIEKLEALIKK